MGFIGSFLLLLIFITLPGLVQPSLAQASLYAGDLGAANYEINEDGLLSLRFSGRTEYLSQHRFAVPDENTELASILSKAMASIRAEEANAVSNRWLGMTVERGVETEDLLKYGSILAGVFLLFVCWAYRMQREIARRKAAEMSERSRSNILEMLVNRASLPKILEAIVLRVEQQNVGLLCSIFLFDRQGKHIVQVIGPSLPDIYKAPIEGMDVRAAIGSWNTTGFADDHFKSDDASRRRYQERYEGPGANTGFGACRSQPILSSSGEALGAFAIYRHEAATPAKSNTPIIEESVRLSSIAIERSIAAETIHESEAHFRLLTEDVMDVVWKTDRDFHFTYISPADGRLRGYRAEEMIGRHVFEVFTQEGAATVEQVMRRRQEAERRGVETGSMTFEVQHRCKDGRLLWGEVLSKPDRDAQGAIVGYHGITRDISERKKAEEERRRLEQRVRQIEKAESLGRMAGAIAHNFNNMLMVVRGNLELALHTLPHEPRARSNIAEAMKASQRAAEISQFMLTYLGQGSGKAEPVDAAKAYRAACTRLNVTMPANISLSIGLPPSGTVIQVDADHLGKILTSLVSNAVEAIGQREGEIALNVQVMKGTEVRESKLFPLDWEPKAKEYVCLSVADTGCGMDAATLENIFDPFYTTKFTGRGLGLPVVLGLVRTLEGAIGVESRPGQGSVFNVYFPMSSRETMKSAKDESSTRPSAPGARLALVIDDEAMVRNMAESILKEMLGYEVVAACDGPKALEIFSILKDEISLVLLDLSMPGMNGWQTLSALRALRPDVPVILASGYDESRVMQESNPERPQAFLHKPYGVNDLKAAIAVAQKAQPEGS